MENKMFCYQCQETAGITNVEDDLKILGVM